MLSCLGKEYAFPSRWEILAASQDAFKNQGVQWGKIKDVDVVPDSIPIADHNCLFSLDSLAHEDGDLLGYCGGRAIAFAIDSWRNNNVSWNIKFLPGFNHDNIGDTLTVWTPAL